MAFRIDKMVVAAEERSPIAESIDALRRSLEDEQDVMVASDGSANALAGEVEDVPADTDGASSMADPEVWKAVPKATVAAPDNSSDSSVSDAIAALRESLTSGEVLVNSDGTVYNPGTQATNSSIANGDTFKPVPKATVAAGSGSDSDSSVSDAIAALRESLTSGEVLVNSDGTVYNPGTQATNSSIANGDTFKPVPKATVAATQWYEQNPDLQRAEIAAMRDIRPDAQWGYLPNGKMYWQIQIHPVNVKGERHDWTLLAVYDSDHPQQRWGGSVKYYPVKPNYSEMMRMVEESSVSPKKIPHLLRDEEGQMYMCTQDRNRIKAEHRTGGQVTTAATGLRFAMRWINVFELGLLDQKTWNLFHDEGRI